MEGNLGHTASMALVRACVGFGVVLIVLAVLSQLWRFFLYKKGAEEGIITSNLVIIFLSSGALILTLSYLLFRLSTAFNHIASRLG